VVIATSTPSETLSATAAAFGAPVIVNPRREGIGADWNFALGATDARYVTLAHQDDVYYPSFLERSLALLAAHEEAALCFTSYHEIDDEGRRRASKLSVAKHLLEAAILGSAPVARGARLRAFLSLGCPLPCSSVTYDRDRLGDFQFSTELGLNLDWEAWLRLGERGVAFARTPERLVGRRHNPLTATSEGIRSGRRQAEDLMFFRRLWPSPLAEAIAFLYRASY
jgi:hypothetical protein